MSPLQGQLRRLGAEPETLALLQRAADCDPKGEALAALRDQAGVGAEVPASEVRAAAAAVLIARTAEHLEAAGRASARLGDGRAAALGHGGSSIIGFRLAAQHGAPERTGEGPEPVLRGPEPRDLARARRRLAVLRPGQRLGEGDARALLEQTAWAARQALAGTRWLTGLGVETFRPEKIQGACGFGQACTAFHLEDLGIAPEKIHLHQAAEVFGKDSFRHAFAVAEMPDGKAYLLDCTFRQFFQPERAGPNQVGEPGKHLESTRRGRALADELLAKGFVELTDEVATLYGAALTANPGASFRAQDLLRSTMEVDYDREEMVVLPAPSPLESRPWRRDPEPPRNRGPP